ncbi:MAG: hypothetical protein MJ076_02150 [Clostridia bacterium]|nr:hypothetical protein [Clostridia bacterium]
MAFMKIAVKNAVAIGIALMLISLCGCTNFDKNYGVQSKPQSGENSSDNKKDIKIPEIKSDDEIMPTYLDISLYDEENYADIYLGEKYKYNITYCGSEIKVPSSYKEMVKKGWKVAESSEFTPDSIILAGKSAEVIFVNGYDKLLNAVFFNSGKSSVSLKKCPIVKFRVPENIINNPDSLYGQFWVNGVSNESAITDIVEYLGSPSHFYAVNSNEYYLDYFLSKKDKRTGITVYVNPMDDVVNSIEISYY